MSGWASIVWTLPFTSRVIRAMGACLPWDAASCDRRATDLGFTRDRRWELTNSAEGGWGGGWPRLSLDLSSVLQGWGQSEGPGLGKPLLRFVVGPLRARAGRR